jgi:hypothetical protein
MARAADADRRLPGVALLLDRPAWPAHGRLWSHLISDTSYEELHAFARRVGVPSRSFEGDHYDVPAERYDELVAAGARPVEGREIVRALTASGLRLPKRKGERVLDSWPAVPWPGHPVPCRVDCLASPLPPPAATTIAAVLLAVRDGRVLLDERLDALPAGEGGGRPVGYLRARFADGRGREHVAALRPPAGVAARLPGRWLSLDAALQLTALRWWGPLVRHLAQHDRP